MEKRYHIIIKPRENHPGEFKAVLCDGRGVKIAAWKAEYDTPVAYCYVEEQLKEELEKYVDLIRRHESGDEDATKKIEEINGKPQYFTC